MDNTIDLSQLGIKTKHIIHNPPLPLYYEHAIRDEVDTTMSFRGALIAYSGEKTGRSPSDKRVVKDLESENDVWWGDTNIPIDNHGFRVNRERAINYLNTCDKLFVLDGYAGWDKQHRLKVRVVCERAYHALFMRNMLIYPTKEELKNFGEPDCLIINAGKFPANSFTTGMTSETSVILNLDEKEIVILGTEYAGEMKKGVFSLMNYLMPKKGILSMHSSATVDKTTGSSSLLFGLSGTGKTTLSADPNRYLIGDDEHCWSDEGIFNIEGGCYAKAINLTREAEPEIFDALRFGSVLENVVYKHDDNRVDFTNASITENTRGCYPIEHIQNVKMPCVGPHPDNIIFLTCDAFGVLPPVSKLTPEQAEYYFISGYTAKVAGTEMGVTEPQATFSPCFGGPFMVWHPKKYAELLSKKLQQHDAKVWLINTGWTGGEYGDGKRMSLTHTRRIITAIYAGDLDEANVEIDPVFGLHVVTKCPDVPSDILLPRNTWNNKAAYDVKAQHLANLFVKNFEQYKDVVRPEVINAGPTLEEQTQYGT